MSPKKNTFIIIDGNALLHRAWHAIPPLTTKSGKIVNAAYGFTSILLKVLKDLRPCFIAVTFDTKAPTFRHKEFKEYKAQREKQPDELYEQIPIVKEIVKSFGFPIFEASGFEADDLIATLEKKIHKINSSTEIVIVTGDLDTLQLVDKHTKVYTLKRSINDTITYDLKAVKDRYNLGPEQLIDYKALYGDPSDNIPGVKGIGEKTAKELIAQFGSLENLYNNLDKINLRSSHRVRKLLKQYRDDAFLSKRLVTLISDIPLKLDFKKSRITTFDQDKIHKVFSKYEFKSLLNRVFDLSTEKKKQQSLFLEPLETSKVKKMDDTRYVLVRTESDFKKFLTELKKQKEFVFDTETTSLDPLKAKLLGISFSWKKHEAYYVPVNHTKGKKFIEELRQLFTDSRVKKNGHNLKFDIAVLETAGIKIKGIYFDSMIASYVLNPGTRGHSLDNLSFVELGHQMIPIETLIGKGTSQISMEQVPLEKLYEYACEDADITWQLIQKLKPRLKKKTLDKLFHTIEMPLVKVLAKMERNGVKIDVKFLDKMGKELEKKIVELEKRIQKIAGVAFNVNSPIQLKEVLFEKLKISSFDIRKTKTGLFSTASSELEKLKDNHPIVPLIIKHRELSKLKNTYLDAIPKLVDPKTSRVHTSYNQTITSTGRLSSSDPNLQNIPIRTELGEKIRHAFIADNGYMFISADYSQIELRIVASLSNDKKMIEIFKRGEDIHKATAAAINKLPLQKVTKEMRYAAKEVNFGILYGMGAYGLSRRTGITVSEAQRFIDSYFSTFSGVKAYIEKTLDEARKKGYVKTLFGRIRYIPEIHSGIFQVRSAAERMAINMPIQGTAADLIKIAMINIDKHLEEKYKPEYSKMILQVHDELVFEVREDLVDEVSEMVKTDMEMAGAGRIKVPIKVDIRISKSWGE